MNPALMRAAGFGKEVDRVLRGRCPICNNFVTATALPNPLYVQEFRISGMCARCQDSVFTADDEEE